MGTDSDEDDATRQVAFLRARIIEAAREGDKPEIKYLVGISAAKRLLAAFDEVTKTCDESSVAPTCRTFSYICCAHLK